MTYEDLKREWSNPERDCISANTSGSTGKPKEILLRKSIVKASAERSINFFGITSSSRLHSCISPDFIGGKMMMIRALLCGASFSYETPSNRPKLRGPGGEWPDIVSVVPSQVIHILDNIDTEFAGVAQSTILLIGGSPIHPDLRRRIADSGIRAFESYGMTETASHIALRPISNPPSGFTPLSGISISLDSRDCLVITLPDLNPIVTNDLAKIHSDGSFDIIGRADNVIISGGKKIIPEEVERILLPLLSPLGINEIMLTSRPDIKWGERLHLLMTLRKDRESASPTLLQTVQDIAHTNLKTHEVPKTYEILPSLPRTSNGKLLRRQHANP